MHIEETPGRNFKRLKVISGDSDEKEALLQDAKENLTENINLVVKLSEEILGFVENEKDIERKITNVIQRIDNIYCVQGDYGTTIELLKKRFGDEK